MIPREYIPAVEAGVREAVSNGPLAGFPVIDLKVTLVDGSYHDVDSSELAFKAAGSIAIREGVRKAKPMLLEPIMVGEIVTPGDFLGDVIGHLGTMRAKSPISRVKLALKWCAPLYHCPRLSDTLRPCGR